MDVMSVMNVSTNWKGEVAFTGAELWASCHIGTGIICACLPTYRPLLAKIATTAASLRQRYSYKSWRFRSTGSDHSATVVAFDGGNNEQHYKMFSDNAIHGGDDKMHLTICHGSASQDSVRDEYTSRSIHLDRITVKSTVEVV